MPRCSECGAFNPVHLERCERCGAPLTPFAPVRVRPLNDGGSVPSRGQRGKERDLQALLIIFFVVALIVSITIGYIYYSPEPQQASSVPENPIATGTAILNISVGSDIGVAFHVVVSIEGAELANLELGPKQKAELGSYYYTTGSEKFLHVFASFYNESGVLRYTDSVYFWALEDKSYDILLYPSIFVGYDSTV
jgi:hypothetical protein